MAKVFSGALLADTIRVEAIRRGLRIGVAYSQMIRQDNGEPVGANQMARLKRGIALPRMDVLMAYLNWLGRYDLEEFMIYDDSVRVEPDGSITVLRAKPPVNGWQRHVIGHT